MNEAHNIQFIAIPNREVRTIPKGWRHPKDARGDYIPYADERYRADGEEPEEMMPATHHLPDAETEIAAYETTTEGTPISPPFSNTPDGRLALVQHCAEHATTFARGRADAEAWAAVLFGSATVDLDGTVRAEG